MVRDFTGREIKVGDVIAYMTRKSSHMSLKKAMVKDVVQAPPEFAITTRNNRPEIIVEVDSTRVMTPVPLVPPYSETFKKLVKLTVPRYIVVLPKEQPPTQLNLPGRGFTTFGYIRPGGPNIDG